MDSSTAQKVIAGCILIIWTVDTGKQFVNVCQDNYASAVNYRGYIVLDPAGAPLQQAIECKCYLISGKQQPHTVYLLPTGNGTQNFKTNGSVANKENTIVMNITSKTEVTYQQKKQDDHPHVCMGISNADIKEELTVICKADRKDFPSDPTTEITTRTTSTPSMSKETSTRPVSKETSTHPHIFRAIIGAVVGMVVILIGITVCCVVKRKRRSTNVEVSEDSNSKRMGPSKEQTDAASGSTMGNAAANRKTDDKHDSIMPSEYVDIEQCGVTASAKIKPETVQAESDVYNHLNEVQPGPHSDNVYSTTHVYSATKQESGAISKRGPMASESDVYNHLNEVRPGQHSDNVYNAVNLQDTSMQQSGAMTSQYDSVELVKRKHHALPESDYNVLSFP